VGNPISRKFASLPGRGLPAVTPEHTSNGG
jgi:hypothetical protein